MTDYYWNGWYAGWGWFLWFGMIIVIFSSLGNWGYTYQAHKRYRDSTGAKDATDILNERYALGEIDREEFNLMKSDIQKSRFVMNENKKKDKIPHQQAERVKNIHFTQKNNKYDQRNEAQRSHEI